MTTGSVRVAVDFGCAASYLAVAPTRALESRLGVTFDWMPFPAVTRTQPRLALPGGDRSARHFRMRADYLANDLRRYAESRGLHLGDVHRNADVTVASLGLLWLRGRSPRLAGEYVVAVFDRVWRENAEADVEIVEKLLGTEAQGFRAYATGEGPRDLDAARDELSAAGVWNVPAYLVADQLFIGRQHLPAVGRLA